MNIPYYPLKLDVKNPGLFCQALNEDLRVIAGGAEGALIAELISGEMLVGNPAVSGEAVAIYAQRLFDLTSSEGSEPNTADDSLYSISGGDIYQTDSPLGNDGSLATWRPDIDCAGPVQVEIYSGFGQPTYDLLHPNGKDLRAGDIGTGSRVMMITHNYPDSVDGSGNIDTSGKFWQLIAPTAIHGLVGVDISDTPTNGARLVFDSTAGKWVDSGSSGTSAVSTTNATVTDLATLTLTDDSTYLIEVKCVARQTGGASGAVGDMATYLIRASFQALGGAVTQMGATDRDYEYEDDAAWDVDFDTPAGLDVPVIVTGAANKNINWSMTVNLLRVG